MLKLLKGHSAPARSHEEVFAERYNELLHWALRLTDRDRAAAEDLLHDAFIDFTLGHSDLDAIENIDGYLRTVLRNIYLSSVRKATRHPTQSLSLIEYDSLALGLRSTEPHQRLQYQDQLRAICEYACRRRMSSKAGSALILRYFLEYYPGEVARVMNTTGRAVSEWLRIARSEAMAYLENPDRLSFGAKLPTDSELPHIDFSSARERLAHEFRRALFSLRHSGVCLDPLDLKELFTGNDQATIECSALARIVTCDHCLDRVNEFLRLPSLAERYGMCQSL